MWEETPSPGSRRSRDWKRNDRIYFEIKQNCTNLVLPPMLGLQYFRHMYTKQMPALYRNNQTYVTGAECYCIIQRDRFCFKTFPQSTLLAIQSRSSRAEVKSDALTPSPTGYHTKVYSTIPGSPRDPTFNLMAPYQCKPPIS